MVVVYNGSFAICSDSQAALKSLSSHKVTSALVTDTITALRELAIFNIVHLVHQGIIIPLYKGKGSRSDCSNYRGITLLSVPGKVFAKVILSRIRPTLLAHRHPQRSGFTPGRSTCDSIVTLIILHNGGKTMDIQPMQPMLICALPLIHSADLCFGYC